MRKLRVSFGRAESLGLITSQRTFDWDSFRENNLSSFTVTDVTVLEYSRLNRDERGAYKGRGGWFVGGSFKNRRRRRDNFSVRSMVTLDLDHLGSGDLFDIELAFSGIECAVYATHSATVEKPRVRLVFPLARDIVFEEYQPIARWLANRLDMDLSDDTTFEEIRLMYLPCRASDGPDYTYHSQGEWADPDKILATYEDFRDFGSWPHSSRVDQLRPTSARAEDPRNKAGVIGAFCRTVDVHQAIAKYVPDHWELTDDDDRYRPSNSTGGAPGAVVYDDGLFIFSNHETGATAGMNVNAWDLVRLCMFGDQDNGATNDPIGQRPSQKSMLAWAAGLAEVQAEMADADFQGIDTYKDNAPPAMTYESLSDEIGANSEKSLNRDQFKTFIRKIAAARLDATDTDHLGNLLRTASARPLSKKAVTEEIAREHKKLIGQLSDGNTLADVELMLLSEFEVEHYPNGTIKRIGGKFWTFEDGLWATINPDVVYGQLAKTIIRLREERPDDMEQLVAVVNESKTSAQVRALHTLMEGLLAAREERDDPLKLRERTPLPIVNCWNKEIRYNYGGKRSVHTHEPSHFRTVRVDTQYDPDAECPVFDAFLTHCFVNSLNPELMESFICELGGYIIGMSRWLKLWVLFHGETNTGKSTLAEVFTSLLGDSAVERSLKLLEGSSEFRDAGLIGKLLYVDDDLDKGIMLPDGAMKRISEEKMIQCGIKFGDDLRFISKCFPLACSNHWPMTRDLTPAFVERTIVVPFRNAYGRAEASDERKQRMIQGERSGILNRFIEGLSRLRKRGRFDLPPDVLLAREEWLIHANPVADFFYNQMKVAKGHFVRSTQIFEWYRLWHADEGRMRNRMLPRNEFYSRFELLAGTRVKVQGVQGWTGFDHEPDADMEAMSREFEKAEDLGKDDDKEDWEK